MQENLLTLLSNAVKYSLHGPVSLSITLATERQIIGLANRRRGSLRGSWEENRGEKGENRGEKGGRESSPSNGRRKSSFTAQLSASIQRSIESLSQHTRPADPVAIANDLSIMPHTSPNPSPHHRRSHGLGVLRSDSASASPVDSHLPHQHQQLHDDHPTLFSLPSLRQLFVKTSSLLQVLPSLPSLTLAGPTKIHPQPVLTSSKKGLGPPEEVLYVLFEVTDSGTL